MTDLVERLREYNTHEGREKYMRAWDTARSYFKDGDKGGSWPRDIMESWLDGIIEDAQEAADALEAKDVEIERLRETILDQLQNMGQQCDEIDRLRGALERIAEKYYDWSTAKEVARAALQKDGGE